MHRLGTHLPFRGLEVVSGEGTANFTRGFDGKAILEVRNVTPDLHADLRSGIGKAVEELCRKECDLHARAMRDLLGRMAMPTADAPRVRLRTEAVMHLERQIDVGDGRLTVCGQEHVLTIRQRVPEDADELAVVAALLINGHKLRIRQVEALYRRILESILHDARRN